MRRRKYAFDEARTQRFLTEGRGAGQGCDYLPWLRIQDLPSKGRSHRPFGIKTQRVHHLLSDGEWKCFLQFEADVAVQDIREQFPMNRLLTMRAATDIGVRHPHTLDGTPFVMTIDFLVTRLVGGESTLEPYTFKYEPDTLRPREKELLRIAAAFWTAHGYALRIIDESFFDEPLVINYDCVRSYHDLSKRQREGCDTSQIAHAVLAMVQTAAEMSLLEMSRQLGEQLRLDPHAVFSVVMHLLAHRVLSTDLSSPEPLERRPLHAFRQIHNAGELPWA